MKQRRSVEAETAVIKSVRVGIGGGMKGSVSKVGRDKEGGLETMGVSVDDEEGSGTNSIRGEVYWNFGG